jgi:hypothetical protein
MTTLTPVQISKKVKDLTGQQFQMLTVLFPVGVNSGGNMQWACECKCGNKVVRAGAVLQQNNHLSNCGCVVTNAKHGASYTPEYALYQSAKKRAKRKGTEFSIELEDIVIPETCPCLGINLSTAVDQAQDNSPSLDRIDPLKGYTRDNIWVISYKANRIKNNATKDELLAVAKAVAEKT